ncbi:hypothetical protein RI129_010053 [Pyrocoelia pectoralis]|uniref:Cytochrome P450 n=1 Tax=Pyrocoelia pectoralis TaxID=417401 RepID=A0AAN7VAI1_9COLE
MILTILTCTILILLYLKMRRTYKYWRNLNVVYVRPWPLFGYMAPSVLRLKAFPMILQKVYNVFPEQRYFGAYQFGTPVLFIRSPNLIKKILSDDFATFPDRRIIMEANVDPLWAKNLHAMQGGNHWHNLRTALSLGLTDNHLSKMFESMKTCAKNFAYFFLDTNTESIELLDVTSKFVNDVIASTVFGVSYNSLENSRNDFYLMSKDITKFNLMKVIKLFGFSKFEMLKFRIIEERTNQFYKHVVENASPHQENHLVRILIKNGIGYDGIGDTETDKDVLDEAVAQGIHFLISGFETVFIGLSFLVYELAINANIQEKLRQEVDAISELCKDLSYGQIGKMQYLDMVVSESLRKWPPTVLIDRKSVKPFTIEAEKVWDTTTTFNENTICLIPSFAIHRDKKYYPNPDEFDPERFSPLNRQKIKPNTYIPFGFGPRNCIGFQFALLEIKTAVFHLLSEFEIVSTDKTKNPIKLSTSGFQLSPAGGIWVGLKPRRPLDTL